MSRENAPVRGVRDLEQICRRVLNSRFARFRDCEIRASFYPYIGLTHKIRKRESRWVIRMSDHCRAAPDEVLQAIALILGCKILGRRPPADVLALYAEFCNRPEIQRRVRSRRLERGRKMIGSPEGRHHSLGEIFGDLNRRYFNDQIELNKLGWSLRSGWRRLGHYDPLHQTITLSPVLDSPEVPARVISYILYHEMLHALFDESGHPVRRHHSVEFRRTEMAYPGYAEAKDFLREFCRKRDRYKR